MKSTVSTIVTIVLALLAFALLVPANGIAGPPEIPTQDVNVVNTPLDVNVTNTPVREPVSIFDQLFAPPPIMDEVIYTVPSGKRFMIETLSVSARLGSGVDILRMGFLREAGGIVWVPMFRQGENAAGTTFWAGTEQVRVEVRPTEDLRLFLLLSSTTGNEVLNYSVFGYKLDTDSPSLAP